MASNDFPNYSYWCCDGCDRNFIHGEVRYNCTVCHDLDFCQSCKDRLSDTHGHPLSKELAYGAPPETNADCEKMTMPEAILFACQIYHDRLCMGIRDKHEKDPSIYKNSYSWVTFKVIGERIENFGYGLRFLLKPRDYLGICAKNCPEWMITDYACTVQNFISVPMYCSFTDTELSFVINNAQLSVIVCDLFMLKRIVSLKDRCPSIRDVICIDETLRSDQIKQEYQTKGSLKIHRMKDIELTGSTNRNFKLIKMAPTDCITIIYTSGSTGFPKGVMISEEVARRSYSNWFDRHQSDRVVYCYRPLAWATDRDTVTWGFLRGGRAAFSTGDLDHLIEEISIVRPTQFSANPSFWNKIYTEFQTAMALMDDSQVPKPWKTKKTYLLEKFSKLLPNRCHTIMVGGAKISPVVFEFINQCFSKCRVHESYGITECGGVTSTYSLYVNVEYRLESAPEMGYTVDDKPYPRGEILVKTPQMFLGYHNNPEETAAVMTSDGFYRTGDIVEVRHYTGKSFNIIVIDRRKNFFKLAQGQFISPEYLQGIYIQSPFVEQIYVHGDIMDDCVSAVVVPNRKYVQSFIDQHQIKDFNEKSPDQKLVRAILEDFQRLANEDSLRKHEIPVKLIIDFQPFTIENGFLTPSLKPCRPKLAAYYGAHLKSMNSIEQRLKSIINRVTGRKNDVQEDDNSFSDLGGDSLTAIRLSKTIEKDLGISVPVDVILGSNMNLQNLTNFIKDPSKIHAARESTIQRILNDAQLDFTLKPIEGNKKNSQPTSIIFVTGTTGFVGSFLLAELLEQYPITCKFICLIRSNSNKDPIDSIREKMKFYKIWNECFEGRIIPLVGDLSKSQFGLANETYRFLAQMTDLIFHCAAAVNFVLSYDQLYSSNVFGTKEIIKLASYTSRSIPIHYISTLSVLPSDFVKEQSIDEITPDQLYSGYGQSKWVAEKLIQKASSSNIPVVIYRLGLIGPSSKTAACNKSDLHTILMSALVKTQVYPENVLSNNITCVTVDSAVQSIVYISLQRESNYGKVYHVVYPEIRLSYRTIIAQFQQIGLMMKQVSDQEWTRQLEILASEHVYFETSINLLVRDSNTDDKIVHCHNFMKSIKNLGFKPLPEDYVINWIKFISNNIVP